MNLLILQQRVKFNLRSLLFVFAISFLAGCATIFKGHKQKVIIEADGKNFSVKHKVQVLGSEANSRVTLALSKSLQLHEIEIMKNGYESQTFTFRRQGRIGLGVFKWYAVAAGMAGLYGGYYLQSSNIPNDQLMGKLAFGAGSVFFLNIVDLVLRSQTSFVHKKLNFDLIPIPQKQNESDMEAMICSSVNFKILPGKMIGSVYHDINGRFIEKEAKLWQETSNVSYEELAIQANEEFARFGCNVSNKIEFNSKTPRYSIKAEVLDYKVDEYIYSERTIAPEQTNPNLISYLSPVDRNSKQNIKWTCKLPYF